MQEVLHSDIGINEGNLSADRVMRAKKRPASAEAEGRGEKHYWNLQVVNLKLSEGLFATLSVQNLS